MSELPVILFVDDEEGILAGLRSSLRKLRRTYRFLFANGAKDALTQLAAEPVDVVVTDIRMPGMTGVELLERVRDQHPGTVRYVLSGEAGIDLVMRSVPVAHRWLAKPCDYDVLTEALADAVRHRSLTVDPAITAAIGDATALPTPPTLYAELLDLAADADASMPRVAELVGRDPAVSAKLMQWANSAFAGGQPVGDLQSAAVRLGLDVISQLILTVEVTRSFASTESIPGTTPEALADHVDAVATSAARLARRDGSLTAGLAGLLSYIGLLVAVGHIPDRLAAAYELADRADIELIEAERELWGLTHPELGAHVLSVWGLPSETVLLVAGAHDRPAPASIPTSASCDRAGGLDPDDAVRVAGLLAQRRPTFARFGSPYRTRVDEELAAALSAFDGAADQELERTPS